jgi:chromosome segregation protein
LRHAREAHLAARDAHDAADRAARRTREAVDAARGEASRAEDRSAALRAELAALEFDSGPATGRPTGTDASALEALESAAAAARARRDALAAVRDAARDRWSTTRERAADAELQIAGRRRAQGSAEARVAQLRAALPERSRGRDELTAERSLLGASLADATRADEAAAARHNAAESHRAGRRSALLELERAQGDTSGRLAELEGAAQASAVEASRQDEALASIAREREMALDALPETDVSVPTAEIEALNDEDLDAELRRVRRTLGQIGSVNPFAVEEHREVAGRLEEVSSQEGDLRAAIASTEELIARLDSEIATQFDAAFRAIAERFDEFCRLLFAGGSGSLSMGDEADGDAPGGIEIVVRPPGKRLQRLGMLSGGERALTGVALLFAMLTVNPVPFCILDEVDAALDEANIGRFAQALRRLSESIDFVVITHNRATIEVADTIYGVTMTDAAVSRVLSLRLADLPAEAIV